MEGEGMGLRWVMHAKLHNGRVTDANVAYVGSIEIDADIIDAVGLWVGQRVLVVSNNSGARLETYIIAGARGSRTLSINGAAAHLIKAGEQVIVMGFELADGPVSPKVALLDDANQIVRFLDAEKNERP